MSDPLHYRDETGRDGLGRDMGGGGVGRSAGLGADGDYYFWAHATPYGGCQCSRSSVV